MSQAQLKKGLNISSFFISVLEQEEVDDREEENSS